MAVAEVVDFGAFGDDDDDAVVDHSIEAAIRADLASRKGKAKEIVHPDAPKWKVSYRLPTDRSELRPFLDRMEKAAKRRQEYHFAAAVLANQCESIAFRGERLEDASGRPMTFRDREVMRLLGDATSPSDAVRNLYGSDGIVSAVNDQLMQAAGYGSVDDVQVDDPQDPSSGG